MERESICLDCLYGSQPFCYYPIVCVQGKEIKEMWHDKFKCKHFYPAPESPRQTPWKVIITK